MNSNTLRRFVTRHRLPVAISAVIAVALLITAINLSLYVSSGSSSLDLSRPGYEQARRQAQTGDTKRVEFESTGPIDEAVLKDFKKLFSDQRIEINALDGFRDTALDDASLRLSAPATTEE